MPSQFIEFPPQRPIIHPMQCWCGNPDLLPFGEGYRRCEACETLVAASGQQAFDPRVGDDSKDLYGKDYWFAHQTADLGCPGHHFQEPVGPGGAMRPLAAVSAGISVASGEDSRNRLRPWRIRGHAPPSWI